jgi:hypothetical protein
LSTGLDSRLVIADGFHVNLIERFEQEFETFFEIESKVDVSFGVRNARYLSVERQNKMVAHTLESFRCLQQFGQMCYSMLPEEFQSQGAEPQYYNLRPGGVFYKQLDERQRQYLIYVLRRK